MKSGIHPESKAALYTCGSCGTEIRTQSTQQSSEKLDVCSNCHPAYTGKESKSVQSSRIDSFNERYKSR